jgi:hypothetical protein
MRRICRVGGLIEVLHGRLSYWEGWAGLERRCSVFDGGRCTRLLYRMSLQLRGLAFWGIKKMVIGFLAYTNDIL